jgi:hypothetical protein
MSNENPTPEERLNQAIQQVFTHYAEHLADESRPFPADFEETMAKLAGAFAQTRRD